MGAVVVALLVAQVDLFGGGADEAPPVEAPRPKPDDTPYVRPPPDGPVPDNVPKGEDAAPLQQPKPRPRDEQRRALQLERQQLLDSMPGYVVPTIVTTLGGLALVVGGALGVLGLTKALQDRPDTVFILGASVGIVGLAAFVFGLIWERERFLQREPINERIEEIDKELGW